tara:strand:+ start:436 stop:894 length:459 start_codon:yes stop_codon:yes gene_type:complete
MRLLTHDHIAAVCEKPKAPPFDDKKSSLAPADALGSSKIEALVHEQGINDLCLFGCDRNQLDWSGMPYKHNASRRHHIGKFTADGAYDGYPAYDAVFHQGEGAKVVIPPRSNAVERPAPKHMLPERRPHNVHADRWPAEMAGINRLWQTGFG